METAKLKKFAQSARRTLLDQVSNKLALVLKEESAARRHAPQTVKQLEDEIAKVGKSSLIDQVAYIWFNRFCALRFMDVNHYNPIGVLSPAESQSQPEILAEAKAGIIDDTLVDDKARNQINGLLSGSIQSLDAQTEAYRQLIVSVCNAYHRLMPYLFERIDDYTELLMPDDLLSENSLLSQTRDAMTAEACQSVEVIGWLYQFYISEKKDEVIGKVVKSEDIPAATQLFTPNWIVKYLVQNSLGRQWMLTYPNSNLKKQMEYFIPVSEQPDEALQALQALIPKTLNPEEIKVLDPACGSGHILVEAYDLLYAIYLEAGYDSVDIPELILSKNLYGVEIDERASELAAFALSMKAIKGNPKDDSNNRRRFFRNPIKPNICKLDVIKFNEEELEDYKDFVGTEILNAELRELLKAFEHADCLGSLIQPEYKGLAELKQKLQTKDLGGQLFIADTHKKVLKLLEQAEYLSQTYDCVIANPPYMGSKYHIKLVKDYLKENYKGYDKDLFSAFIVRNLNLTKTNGQLGFMTPFVWMFISSYEQLRAKIIDDETISTLIQLEYSGFDGATVPICTFTLTKGNIPKFKGTYIRLSDFKGAANQGPKTLQAIKAERLRLGV